MGNDIWRRIIAWDYRQDLFPIRGHNPFLNRGRLSLVPVLRRTRGPGRNLVPHPSRGPGLSYIHTMV